MWLRLATVEVRRLTVADAEAAEADLRRDQELAAQRKAEYEAVQAAQPRDIAPGADAAVGAEVELETLAETLAQPPSPQPTVIDVEQMPPYPASAVAGDFFLTTYGAPCGVGSLTPHSKNVMIHAHDGLRTLNSFSDAQHSSSMIATCLRATFMLHVRKTFSISNHHVMQIKRNVFWRTCETYHMFIASTFCFQFENLISVLISNLKTTPAVHAVAYGAALAGEDVQQPRKRRRCGP